MRSHSYIRSADRVGIISAVICTIHCLLVPLLFLLKYWWTNSEEAAPNGISFPAWWGLLDYVFLIIGFVAVFHASKHAPARGVKMSLWFFWLCLAVAIIFEQSLHWMAYIASAGLITTHFINIRRQQMKALKSNPEMAVAPEAL